MTKMNHDIDDISRDAKEQKHTRTAVVENSASTDSTATDGETVFCVDTA